MNRLSSLGRRTRARIGSGGRAGSSSSSRSGSGSGSGSRRGGGGGRLRSGALLWLLGALRGLRSRRSWCWQISLTDPDVDEGLHWLGVLVGEQSKDAADIDEVHEAGVEVALDVQFMQLEPMRPV